MLGNVPEGMQIWDAGCKLQAQCVQQMDTQYEHYFVTSCMIFLSQQSISWTRDALVVSAMTPDNCIDVNFYRNPGDIMYNSSMDAERRAAASLRYISPQPRQSELDVRPLVPL